MKKHLAARILGLAVLYCVVFFVIVIIQFSNKGNFSVFSGNMNIKGRYLDVSAESEVEEERLLASGIKIYFGGLEFVLSEERGKGMTLTSNGTSKAINPESLAIKDNTARFMLVDGSALIFNSLESARGPELQINVDFAQDATELSIPITARRSSLVRDNGQLGISYSGTRFSFTPSSDELETGLITLTRENSFIGYRARVKQQTFDPADYIITQTQNYDSFIVNWRDLSFTYWQSNPASLLNEDNVTAYCNEALHHTSYVRVVESIPSSFVNNQTRSFKPSAYVGGMNIAFNSFNSQEKNKIDLLTRQIQDRSLEFLKEEHLLEFLFVRNNLFLVNDVINIIQNAEAQLIVPDYCAGLLEIMADIKRWRPASANPAGHLTEQIFTLISENFTRDAERNLVFTSNGDLEYCIRLGKVLITWAQANHDTDWQNIGKSLIISALTAGEPGNGKLYNALRAAEYYPRAAFVADNGIWAWTISPSVRASYIEGNLNFTATFPVGMTHHVILRGIRPFIKIQIHGMDWRTDSQFERYDSSGWVYFAEAQTLILKMRHRETTESVRIFYRVETPSPPPPAPASEAAAEAETDDGEEVEQ